MTKKQQSDFLNLISKGRIKATIDGLLQLNFTKNAKKELLVIASQFQQLQQKSRQGILLPEQENIQQNQITARLIDFINQPERLVLSTDMKSQPPTKSPFWQNKIVQYLGIFGSLASMIALYFVFYPPHTNDNLQLTVFVTDTEGNVVLENEGELNIPLGNRSLNAGK